MGEESLQIAIDQGVAQLTLNRPKRKNALDGPTFRALASALDDARSDNRIRVVLLAGEGGNFCSGMDLASSFEDGSEPYDVCAEAVNRFDKPIIAAVDGVAIGGGATIPLHCDIVYVGESLRMRLPFVSLGLVPEFASSYTLQANIGARRAAELMYTAEWIDAARALETGIATAIYADAELHRRSLDKAREIARWPLSSLQATKQCLKAVHAEQLDRAVAIEQRLMQAQVGSPANTEAITAFMEKREPDFSKVDER